MAGNQQQQQGEAVPDPQTWQTGDEPATERQQAYVERLARDAGVEVPEQLTKAEASEAIDELKVAD